ncbi:DNA-directed RNA polymerase, subunit C11/M/9 [Penicillium occitanis (nom. inval.)]|nr:DNA-directed RNA polymerase, subunit C11/M/9 [Penicillium occitanis (nom. inval.)]PCH04245.1 hypothetical protein PENOC_034470 [Penicillium occitanis (nom. inval.)]
MSAIGSLIFCTDCGNLLRESTGSPDAILECDIPPQTIISESKPNAFPSALRAKRSALQTLTAADRTMEAVTQHTCAECGRKEMFFTTAQLRSADEGTTVFYRCVCGYKETVNN